MNRQRQHCFNLLSIGILLIAWCLSLAMYEPVPAHAQAGACARPLDVLLLFDVTSSMGKQLSLAKSQIDQLITTVQADIPDSRFGFGSFADYPIYGNSRDSPWDLNQSLTNDARLVRQRIAEVPLQDGGDGAESYARALFEAGDIAAIGWRDTASRLIILVGDAPAHDPDPGRDGVLGTSDDLRLTSVLDQLRTSKIFVYPISYGSGESDFAQISSATGGQVFTGGSADGLLDQIRNAVVVGCATAVPVSGTTPTSAISVPPGGTSPPDDSFSIWPCLIPLLLLLLLLSLFLFLLRRRNREAIRRGMPLAAPGGIPLVSPSAPPDPPTHPAMGGATPAQSQIQPALALGLGLAGRWSLTYLKEILAGHRDTVALLSLDLTPADDDSQPMVSVLTPDSESGSSEVTLVEALGELIWLGDTSAQIEALIRRDPVRFPRLAAWLSSLDGLDDQAAARLRLLYAIREVAKQLTQQIELLGLRGGRDIYLIANLGEALGAGGVTDMAQAIRYLAHKSGVSVAIHALLIVPTPDSADLRPGATYAAWRAVERGQLVFGRNPSDPPAFDLTLLGAGTDGLPTDNRLFDTCALLNADRDIASLVNIRVEHGLYPMIADVIIAELERPASGSLEGHRANIGGRVSLAQQRLGHAFYRSAGSFTYHLAPAALLQQATDALLVASIDRLVSPGTMPRIEPLLAELSQVFGYRLFTANPDQRFSREIILGLLQLPADRDILARYANDALPRQVRYELLTHKTDNLSAVTVYANIQRRWFGEDGQGGTLGDMLTQRANDAEQRFRTHLRSALAAILNRSDSSNVLSDAIAMADALAQRAKALAVALDGHRHTLEGQISAADIAAARDRLDSGPSWWRRLFGHVTSPDQDRALEELQEHQSRHIEWLAAGTAAGAAAAIAASAGEARATLQTLLTTLKIEYAAATQRLEAATFRRRTQVLLGLVRHEWGMPYTDVVALRDYLDLECALPQAESRRRHIVVLRQYIAGQHVADLVAKQSVGPDALVSRIHWTWATDTTSITPQPVLINGQQQISLAHAAAWRAATSALNGWVWDLRLADLLAEELDQPSLLARQLVSELLSPAIRYLPTPDDQHEHFTFLIATPSPAHRSWYTQVIEAQQRAGIAHSYHHQLDGSDPYRVHALALAELIAPLQRGAMPALDWIADAAKLDQTGQTRSAVTLNEAIAARFERQPVLARQPLHPFLVAAMNDTERIALFARALLTGVIGPDPTQSGLQVIVLPPLRGILATDTGANPDVWVEALRHFTLADADLITAVAQRVDRILPNITESQYEIWLAQSIPASLRAARSQPPRDLAGLIQSILDPFFEP
jgi:hypothetical protein